MSQHSIPDIEKIRQLNDANQALIKQQERLELIIQGTNDGIWDWNIETGQFYFSSRWHSMLGYKKGEIEPSFHGWLDLVHPDDLGRFLLCWTEYMEGITDHFDIEYRLKHKEGHYFWVEGRGVSTINGQGLPYRMAGANSDIHSRKKAEALLIQAKENAEDASEAQKRFLSTMSHELRTPLNAIIGFSEIIKDELEEAANAETEMSKDIKRIHAAGTHLLTLVNQVLDIASIDNNELELVANAFSVDALLTSIKHSFLSTMTENTVTFDFEADIGIASLDQSRLKKAIDNLLDNANKFTHQGNIHFHASKSNDWLMFKITDTGIGLTKEQLRTVFDPFVQIDNTYSRKYEGSGLGLTVSKYYANLMGGDVKASSVLEQGSTFTLTVPVEWEPQP